MEDFSAASQSALRTDVPTPLFLYGSVTAIFAMSALSGSGSCKILIGGKFISVIREGEGKDVLLLHGYLSSKESFYYQIKFPAVNEKRFVLYSRCVINLC